MEEYSLDYDLQYLDTTASMQDGSSSTATTDDTVMLGS
jgi:hypothetical protein